jgi:hypothetical protein
VIERDQLSPDECPQAFYELQGNQFWIEDREGKPARTITPKRDEDLYYDTLNELCNDLMQTLRTFKRHNP